MDKDKPSKKPARKKPPTKTSPAVTPSIADASALSPEESKQFIEQINNYLKKKDHSHKEMLSDYKILQTNISEFLESYITFGYTFEGQRVLIQNYSTPKDKDALLEFLKNVFVTNSSGDLPYSDHD